MYVIVSNSWCLLICHCYVYGVFSTCVSKVRNIMALSLLLRRYSESILSESWLVVGMTTATQARRPNAICL